MLQVQLLHEDVFASAEVFHGAGFEHRPIITRNECDIWRVCMHDYIISINIRNNLLKESPCGRPSKRGRLWNAALSTQLSPEILLTHNSAQPRIDTIERVSKLGNAQRLNTSVRVEDSGNVIFESLVFLGPLVPATSLFLMPTL